VRLERGRVIVLDSEGLARIVDGDVVEQRDIRWARASCPAARAAPPRTSPLRQTSP